MVGTGATANGGPVRDDLSDKDDNCGYASGGCKSDDGMLSCGYSSFIGKRLTMEDFYDIKASEVSGQPVWMFGIFDGHGGARAAEFLKRNLFENLLKHPKFITDTKLAISETYQQTDIDFLETERDKFRDDGSTASAAVLLGNHLYVANVGDSRTIISHAGIAIPLSDDHKPNRSDERKRIESAGGWITWAGTWRVGGILAMSRAFGNRMLKPFVVAEPEIQDMEINKDLDFLVLASDGLWDVMSNEDVVSLVGREEDPETAARKLTEAAYSRGSSDNITCIVVKFHHLREEHDPLDDDEAVSDNLLHMKSDPVKNEPMKADPDNHPVHKADPDNDPDPAIHVMKSDQEIHDIKSYPDNDHDPAIHVMKSDLEIHDIKSDPVNDPMMANPEIHAIKSVPDNDPMKAKPEIHSMNVDPENDAMKADPEIHPMKADP